MSGPCHAEPPVYIRELYADIIHMPTPGGEYVRTADIEVPSDGSIVPNPAPSPPAPAHASVGPAASFGSFFVYAICTEPAADAGSATFAGSRTLGYNGAVNRLSEASGPYYANLPNPPLPARLSAVWRNGEPLTFYLDAPEAPLPASAPPTISYRLYIHSTYPF